MLLQDAHHAPSPSITLHHPPSSYYVPINTQPHYIDWERCSIGEVGHEHIDHIDPPCEPWENVDLQISPFQ